MRFAVILLRWVMNFFYFFLKLLPTKQNKLVFLSRQSNKPSEDFLFLSEQLKAEKPDIEIVAISCRADHNFRSMRNFAKETLRSMYHLATSRVCLLDSYWPAVSVLRHKKQLAVIQMWHAMGKIKQSGYQSLGRKYGRSDMIAKEMRMHRGYDVIIAAAKAFNPFYCASFGVTEDKLFNTGLPRMDKLREGVEDAKKRFYGIYPQLRGKRIILYAPTFRKGQVLDPSALVKAFDFKKNDILIIKAHPNQMLNKKMVRPAFTCGKVSTSTVLSICDCVITDYSAITIEAALLRKPVYFYLFDYEDYLSHNGLNVKLFDEFPDCVFTGAKELTAAVQGGEYDYEAYDRFCEKYLPDLSSRATDRISELIIKCMEKDKKDAITECTSA